MHKTLKQSVTLLSLGLLFSLQSQATPATEFHQKIVERTITSFMQKHKVPGVAVELYVDGKPNAYYFGYADLQRKRSVTGKTIFEVGSFTKLFTSLLVALEVNAGKMDLNAPVNKYLPNNLATSALRNISLEQLATHMSGLAFAVPDTMNQPAKLPAFFATYKPNGQPGKQWEYSNIGIGLLGYALENTTQQNISQLYQNNILRPLGMTPIGTVIPKVLLSNYAQGYTKDGHKALPTCEQDGGLCAFPAAGSLKASAQDMRLFLAAAIGLPNTPANIQRAMQLTQTPFVIINEDMSHGLGWEIRSLDNQTLKDLINKHNYVFQSIEHGPVAAKSLPTDQQVYSANALIDKTGATGGFRCYIAVWPKQKTGIVIMANKFVADNSIVEVGRTILTKITENNATIK